MKFKPQPNAFSVGPFKVKYISPALFRNKDLIYFCRNLGVHFHPLYPQFLRLWHNTHMSVKSYQEVSNIYICSSSFKNQYFLDYILWLIISKSTWKERKWNARCFIVSKSWKGKKSGRILNFSIFILTYRLKWKTCVLTFIDVWTRIRKWTVNGRTVGRKKWMGSCV